MIFSDVTTSASTRKAATGTPRLERGSFATCTRRATLSTTTPAPRASRGRPIVPSADWTGYARGRKSTLRLSAQRQNAR